MAARAAVAGEPAGVVAIYWEPPGRPALGGSVRAAFVESVRPIRARVVDATAPAPPAPSLVPLLDAARSDYERFGFMDAIARLDELQRLADARGGGDLDARQLSEVF